MLPILALAVCGCAITKTIGSSEELLVRGHLENIDFEPNNDPDDLLGHGWFNARLHVSRVLRGHVDARVIPVRYFRHTELSEHQSRPLKLFRDTDGQYLICSQPGASGFRCPSDRNGR